MEKRLYKASYDKKICGVCGGMAHYLNVDTTMVRIVWIILACSWGAGILAYILAALIMPETNEY